jgi:hypothetical protein
MLWVDLTRAAVAAVLIVAAVAKWVPVAGGTTVASFLAALGVPERASQRVARVLPAVELLVGALLLVGTGAWSTYPPAVLTVAFAAVLAWARFTGVTAQCRCFGVLDTEYGATARAALLAVAALAVAFAARSAELAPVSLPAAGVGALAGGVYLALFIMLGHVRAFHRIRRDLLGRRGSAERGKAAT